MPKIPARSRQRGLIFWEHRLAHITIKIERTRHLFKEPYAKSKSEELAA